VSDILDKIKKLMALSLGTHSPEEAASAAAIAQKLIETHQIDEVMLSMSSDDPSEEIPITDTAKRGDPLDLIFDAPDFTDWIGRLGRCVAQANGCAVYWNWRYEEDPTAPHLEKRHGRSLELVGRAPDKILVRIIYQYLHDEIVQIGDETLDGRHDQHYRDSFFVGCTNTVRRKLDEARNAARYQARESAGSALIRVNDAIARIDERRNDAWRWIAENLKLGQAEAKSYNRDAMLRGMIAAERIDVSPKQKIEAP